MLLESLSTNSQGNFVDASAESSKDNTTFQASFLM